jgi:membrane protease subunit HflK
MKKAILESILTTLSRCFIVLIILVIVGIGLSGIRMVNSGEVAVVLRFGKIVGDTPEEQIHKPGVIFCFPYFIDEVVTIPVDNVIQQTVTTHYTEGTIVNWKESGYLMTGDQNIALVSATAKYTISDPVAYALHVSEVSSMVDSCISNAMVEVSAKTRVEDILTSGKLEFASTISARAQEKFDAAGMGISLQALELTNVNMPEEVREIYEEVNAATVTAKTLIEQAQQYYNTNIPLAQSSAQTLLSNANVNYSLSISSAQTSLAEFYGTLEEFNANSDAVKERIFNQKMAAALRNIGTVRLVEDGDSKIFIDWGEK